MKSWLMASRGELVNLYGLRMTPRPLPEKPTMAILRSLRLHTRLCQLQFPQAVPNNYNLSRG